MLQIFNFDYFLKHSAYKKNTLTQQRRKKCKSGSMLAVFKLMHLLFVRMYPMLLCFATVYTLIQSLILKYRTYVSAKNLVTNVRIALINDSVVASMRGNLSCTIEQPNCYCSLHWCFRFTAMHSLF